MKNQKGISRIEISIATIVFVIVIFGLSRLVIMSVEGNNISKDIIKASSLAREKLELYEGLNTLPDMPFTEFETGIEGGYDRTTFIRNNATDSLIPSGNNQIDIMISWTDKSGMKRSTSYSSLLN